MVNRWLLILNQNGKFGRTVYRSPDGSLRLFRGSLAISEFTDQRLIKKELIKYLHSKSRASFIELGFRPMLNRCFQRNWASYTFYTSILNLRSEDLEQYTPKTRNQIRKEEIRVQIIKDGSAYLAEYYEI
jgi:hypothetical protein